MGTLNPERKARPTRETLMQPVDVKSRTDLSRAFRAMSLEEQYAELAPRGMDAQTAEEAVASAFGQAAPPHVSGLSVVEVIQSEVIQKVTAAADAATQGDGTVSYLGLATASGWLAAMLHSSAGPSGNVLQSGDPPAPTTTPGHGPGDGGGGGTGEPTPEPTGPPVVEPPTQPEPIPNPDPEPPTTPVTQPEPSPDPTPEPADEPTTEPVTTPPGHDCPQPDSGGPVAANEKARIWGDPHIIGADGGQFDFQGESGKKYDLLTDSGVKFHGKFEGAKGVTVVTKTWLKVKGQSGSKKLVVHPKQLGKVKLDGQELAENQAAPLPDGGYVLNLGDKVIAKTAEYTITQERKPGRLDADVESGAQGVGADGQLPKGLLGQTFDADDKARDGKKGKGAQGEGAIEGVFRDYEVRRGFDDDWYLATYPDVAAAVRDGRFANGKDHFEKHGKQEGRLKHWKGGDDKQFDEVFYLRKYPDVAAAVAKGDFRAGSHHFWTHGQNEGRQHAA